jgi:hypothetical protein
MAGGGITMTKKAIHVCVDMNLPPWMRRDARALALAENHENASKGAVPTQKKWAPGRVLRVRFLDGVESVQSRVREMAMEWTKYANIGLSFGTDPNAEIRISFVADPGSWSFIGTDNLSIPKDKPTMNFGWLKSNTSDTEYSRVVKHEFGHALGMIHEHQHPEANIPWDKPAVYQYYMSTQGWTKEEVDVNLFQHYDKESTQFSKYDTTSIMHYPVDESLTIGTYSVGWNTELSATDKAFIATVYPGHVDETPLAIGALPFKASIGAHGEQDLYRFTVTKSGVYTVETQGLTDTYMSLFDSNGTLKAEDDDAGAGTNARIVSTLQPGIYKVRVRHYRPTGTGPYTITVKSGS